LDLGATDDGATEATDGSDAPSEPRSEEALPEYDQGPGVVSTGMEVGPGVVRFDQRLRPL
jgi:hypothetical protein